MAIKRFTPKSNSFKSKPTLRSKLFGGNSLASKLKRWCITLVIGFFAITLFWVLSLKFINPPLTYLMIKRGFEWKEKGKGFKIEKHWLDYDELSDNIKRAAIAGEDARFLTHFGFDRKGIEDAIKRNKSGKKLRGGSTISQQVAKNVFLWPGRSWLRKGLEAYFTLLIETIWGKKRILEVYLNVIEMGQGIYGTDAAAQYYFHTSGENLTKRQAALIISILPNPREWDARNPSSFVNRKANVIVKYMNHYNLPE